MFGGQSQFGTKANHFKSQQFVYKNGMPIVQQPRDQDSGPRAVMASLRETGAGGAAAATTAVPAFVALDGKVLRYNAFIREEEEVGTGTTSNYRVRPCIFYYYLVDDSIRIAEPRVENSGMSQGQFLRRHKVPKPEGGFIHWSDLGVGKTIELYARSFYLHGCDDFTRDFMSQQNMPQPENESSPTDPYTLQREEKSTLNKRTSKGPDKDSRWRFQQFNRTVLRFFCAWDDRDALHGERRLFSLHYYMEDQSIEILETRGANSGRDGFTRLLARQRLPKKFSGLSDLEKKDIVTDADLRVGGTVSVFNRDFFIYDCDDSTKKFLREVHGVEDFPDLRATIADSTTPLPRMPPPPYNGFGTPQDSLGSFYNLVPKAPRRPAVKRHLDGKCLRWQAKFKHGTCRPEDEERRFIITLYLVDDTISIFEPPVKNSGMMSGKFLERGPIYKPRTVAAAQEGSNPSQYTLEDFAVGRLLAVHSHVFELVDCDEYTKKFMQTQDGTITSAMTLDDIHREVRSHLARRRSAFVQRFRERDVSGLGQVSGDDFVAVLRENGIEFADGLIIPLLKFWNVSEQGNVDYTNFIELMS